MTEEARLSQTIKSDVLAQLKAAGWSKSGAQTNKPVKKKGESNERGLCLPPLGTFPPKL